MKRIVSVGMMAAAISFAGCADTKKAGGPGVSAPDRDKPMVGQADSTFTLDLPNLATNVKQGEAKVINIGIKRGKNFDQDVTLNFENVPAGLSIEPRKPVIKKSETAASVTLKAAEDAAVNTHVIKVTGQGSSGPPTPPNDLKVDIEKK